MTAGGSIWLILEENINRAPFFYADGAVSQQRGEALCNIYSLLSNNESL